jgi:hypothetical protein
MITILLCVACSAAMAGTPTYAFGHGGAMAMAFFPDMAGINTFMSENGLSPMGDFLIGGGGSGRGGVIGGPAFGGAGWGLMASSKNDELYAELVSAGGGFDIGAAIGGDESSVLTIGAVLGGGANVLSISGYLYPTIEPEGVVPEPAYREIGLAMGFVQPYVSMSAQLFPWMGFEFRLGYLFPLFGIEFGDLLGVPAPSLELSGPTVSFGISFGGIGSGESLAERESRRDERVTSSSDGSFVIREGTVLVIENNVGDIVISSYDAASQTSSELLVEWQAVRTAKQERIDELQVELESDDLRAALTTTGSGRVDYVLRIPKGVDLQVKNGAGSITLTGHQAQTIIVENALGDIQLKELDAIALIVAGGVGRVEISDVEAETLIAEMGLGDIQVELPLSASARVLAKACLGDVSIDRFPGMTGGVSGFLGKRANVTLGLGERTVELNVGLGEITVLANHP